MQEPWKEQFIETNGIKINIHRTGGAKQSIVLLHGISDNGLCWSPITRVLEREFDVVMVDARGHGKSTIDRTDFSFDIMAEDVAGVIRSLGLHKPILGGHSMGGQVATIVAAKYPELVSKIFLEDPAYFVKASLRFLLKIFLPIYLHNARSTANREIEQIKTVCKKQHPGWPDDEIDPWAAAQQQFGRNLVAGKLGKIDLHVAWREIFPKVQCPALLIIPSKGMMKMSQAKEIKSLFNNARIAFIPGAGHSVRREQRAAYLEAIVPFCHEP
jgi:N-formylmaleamate deformylase